MFSLHNRKHQAKVTNNNGTITIDDKNSNLSFNLKSIITISMKSEQEAYAQEMCWDIERIKRTSPEMLNLIRLNILTKDLSFNLTLQKQEADKLAEAINLNRLDCLACCGNNSSILNQLFGKKSKSKDYYPFHLHFSLPDDEPDEDDKKLDESEIWKNTVINLNDPFIGTCDCCKNITALDRKACERFLLCEVCSVRVMESLKKKEVINCNYCDNEFSKELGEFQPNGKFKCLYCLPDGVCSKCEKTKRLVAMARNYYGFQVLCAECM